MNIQSCELHHGDCILVMLPVEGLTRAKITALVKETKIQYGELHPGVRVVVIPTTTPGSELQVTFIHCD